MNTPIPNSSDQQQTDFARAMLKECQRLRPRVSSCRIAWDRKDFDYLREALQTLGELHTRWSVAFTSFRRQVKAPFDDATPMERGRYEIEHYKWLSVEISEWRSLLPAIGRFAKRKDPKSVLRVEKLLRSIADVEMELQGLAKTANSVLDDQMMEYYTYHPPQLVPSNQTIN